MPLQLPVRVYVRGASTVGWIAWMGGPPSDLAFPRAIEAELCRRGRASTVTAGSVPSERVSTLLRSWEREYIGWSPDVVVLAYGHYETIHLFLPRWLERHANSQRARPRRWEELYRRKVLRKVWMLLARAQSAVDRRVPPAVLRHRLRRAGADLERLIDRISQLGNPLVFVVELQPPVANARTWFPGMPARIAMMNDELRAMVHRIGRPDVRLFETSPLVAEHAGDLEAATPDGFHYTPFMHDVIGRELGRHIDEWATTQPHLRAPDETAG